MFGKTGRIWCQGCPWQKVLDAATASIALKDWEGWAGGSLGSVKRRQRGSIRFESGRLGRTWASAFDEKTPSRWWERQNEDPGVRICHSLLWLGNWVGFSHRTTQVPLTSQTEDPGSWD